jgi:hypothetical protein
LPKNDQLALVLANLVPKGGHSYELSDEVPISGSTKPAGTQDRLTQLPIHVTQLISG